MEAATPAPVITQDDRDRFAQKYYGAVIRLARRLARERGYKDVEEFEALALCSFGVWIQRQQTSLVWRPCETEIRLMLLRESIMDARERRNRQEYKRAVTGN